MTTRSGSHSTTTAGRWQHQPGDGNILAFAMRQARLADVEMARLRAESDRYDPCEVDLRLVRSDLGGSEQNSQGRADPDGCDCDCHDPQLLRFRWSS